MGYLATNTVSVIVRKVCRVLTTKVGPMLVKLPWSDNEMEQLMSEMEKSTDFSRRSDVLIALILKYNNH